MVGKYALICAMEIQKIHVVVHIFSGFALFYGKWVYRGVESLCKSLTANKVHFDLPVREFYQPYPSQFCDVEHHYQIRARATK